MERKIFVWTYIVIFIFVIFLLRLWDLQVVKGGEYKKIAERNRLRIIEIPAPRGIIYDRNGKALVRNIPSLDISVIKEDLPRDPETLSILGRLIGLEPKEIKARLKRASVNPFEPVKLRQDVSLKEVARVEARRIDFSGLQVEAVVSREYIYGQFASHVIGYLGRLSIEQLRDPYYSDVPRKAFIGQWGAEKVYDRILRGTAGKKVIEVDALGRAIRVVGIQQPVKGGDIRLTIDMELQAEAEKALQGKTGAVVAIDPNTGEVLALASAPSFNPNLFVRGINYKDWKRLVNDPRKPLLNRALQSQYPPGSTFKIITAIAALEEGIITEDTEFECKGSIYLGGRVFRCWKDEGHGKINLHRAIVESCDVYFYEIAKKLGIDTLAQYASDFGLGRPVGIELGGEKSGILPSTKWKLRTKQQKWFKGETLNAAIGQGYLSATPIQMARLMAAVVNGGKLLKLHILKDSDSSPHVERLVNVKPENINLIKKALIGVVKERNGTGWMARSDIISIGGKTGTTQVIKGSDIKEDIPYKYRDHAWFIAFASEEEPQIVVSVFVEHGGQGSIAAAPIAKRVIEAFYDRP
jgi:penicillin-binding protein 2